MATIRFNTNVPVELRLRSTEGKPVESQFGGMQTMFSAEAGAFYVSETVGALLVEQFRKLNVKVGEPVEITKAEVSRGGGRKGIQWTVERVGAAVGEQGDGTFAVATPPAANELDKALAASIAQVEARKEAQRAATAEQPEWARHLVNQTNVLVDAFASAVRHSTRHEGLVKPDDVRSILLSAFINLSKQSNGGRNAA